MRKILTSLTALMILSSISAQSPFPEPVEVEQFYNTKTLVVLENTMFSTYNAFIKKAMAEYWDITPFEFISVNDFNVKREDPAYSFLVLTETKFDKDKSGSVYNFINLLLGKDVGRIEDLPEMCAIPLSFAGAVDIEYSFKLGIVLRFMCLLFCIEVSSCCEGLVLEI